MNPFDAKAALSSGDWASAHVGVILLRLVLATALGAVIAFRVWRKVVRRTPPPALESAQAQTLIAVAGAIMVTVIGDNMARAFGLVGLGAFIRFRSGIKDPRDAAVMFVMIGIGMACGLGILRMALVGTAFVACLLACFDAFSRARPRRTRVSVLVEDARTALPAIVATLAGARVVEVPSAGAEVSRVVVEADLAHDLDASGIMEKLVGNDVRGVRGVILDEA